MRSMHLSFVLFVACSAQSLEPIIEAGPMDTSRATDATTSSLDARSPQRDIGSVDLGAADTGYTDVGDSPRDSGIEQTFGGEGSCLLAIQCAFQCNDDDQCISDCLATALPRNREITERAMACARQNACNDATCMMSRCPDESRACGEAGGNAPVPPSGDTGMPAGDSYSCADMIRCVNACGIDTLCFNDCLNRVREDSARLAADLTRCMMDARCLNMPCGQQACPDLYQQCIDDD